MLAFVALLCLGIILGSFGTAGSSPEVARLPIKNLTASSETDLVSRLIDGDTESFWSSSPVPSPGRRQWLKLYFGRHWALSTLTLYPSLQGGFATGFEVLYSTDGGLVWYKVPGASFANFPDPGSKPVRIRLNLIVADSLMLDISYLSKDRQGQYTCKFGELEVEGSEPGPFFTSRGGSWDADLNMMWRIFGAASDGSSAVPPLGGEAAYMEWNALKVCWTEDESLRLAVREQLSQYTVGPDGYVWSWGDREGWPTHGHRHYDSNPKYILGACRYYLWSGDDEFLFTRCSATVDMAFSIRYQGSEELRWDCSTHVAYRLERNRTIGQSFVAQRAFTAVGGCFPTWFTTESGMTLRLMKDGPGGELVAERMFSNVPDNAWIMLETELQPPGRYYLEMSCPVGTVGWWSANDDLIPDGEAYRDGKQVQRFPGTVLERLRSAMDFQLRELEGKDGLIVIRDPDSNGTYNGFPTDYWDNFPFGFLSAYANIYFYASLSAMAELEDALGNPGRALELRNLSTLAKQRFNEVFWDEAKGRYIGCVDSSGARHDYGFTYLNMEAVAYGLADPEKARKIYSWLDGKREVEGDHSKGKDIYLYVVAPRSTTIPVENVQPYWWYDIQGAISVGPGGKANYGEHVENGGIIFYTSFYDLISRLLYLSADDALCRLDAIMAEFHKDQLRRDPPNNQGIRWKLGIVGEFPESGLVPTFVVHGFLGAYAGADGLHLCPRLPSALSYVGVEDLWFRGNLYTITAVRNATNATMLALPGRFQVVVPNGRHVVILGGGLRELGEVELPVQVGESAFLALGAILILTWFELHNLNRRRVIRHFERSFLSSTGFTNAPAAARLASGFRSWQACITVRPPSKSWSPRTSTLKSAGHNASTCQGE